jgi:transcriptional regulator ATRX
VFKCEPVSRWLRADARCNRYDNFRNLVNGARVRKPEHKELFRKSLLETPGLVVCDEGHMLKNESAGITQAVMSIRTKRRIILTGTPLQNNLGEYRTMVDFVAPGMLGTPREFKKSFETPILRGQAIDSTDEDVAEMRKRVHVLWDMLKCCVHRADYTVLAKYLPPKHEFVILVRLSPLQVALYSRYLDVTRQAQAEGKDAKKSGNSGVSLFKAYHTLAKVCSHPSALLELEGKEREKKAYESMDDFVVSSSEEEWVSPHGLGHTSAETSCECVNRFVTATTPGSLACACCRKPTSGRARRQSRARSQPSRSRRRRALPRLPRTAKAIRT